MATRSSTFGQPAIELMNSDRDGSDLLDDSVWRQAAFARWGLPRAGVSPADVAALRSVRELLRRLTATLSSGRPLSKRELALFNAEIAKTPVRARFELEPGGRYVLDMTPLAETWIALARRELAGSFGSMLRSDPTRLKLCENDDCRRAFYDASKSRTKRWCDAATCGNRARVRRFRERARP